MFSSEIQKIANDVQRIANNMSGGSSGGSSSGDSGNSGLGFTLVYYDPSNKQSTSLMAVKNGDLVPFTVTDLVGQSVQDAIKTVPILLMPPANGDPLFICNMVAIAQQSGMTMLGFSLPNRSSIVFIANEDSNYAFVLSVDSDDDDDDDEPPA